MASSAESKARWLFAAVLAAAAAGAAAWYFSAAWRLATYEIRTREAVSGLIAGAPVEFHGVEVGKVREVRLADPRSVSILVDLRKDTPVTAATRATITGRGLATRGFTGYVYISLEDLETPGPAPAAVAGGDYPQIATAPGRFVSIDTAVQQMNENVQAVSALLRTAFDPQTIQSLHHTLASLDQLTRTMAAQNGKIETLIANAERASAQLPPLLASSQETVRTLQTQVVPQAQATLLRMNDLTTTVNDRLAAILLHSEQASAYFTPLLQSSNEAVHSLQNEVLPEAQRALVRLDRLSNSLDETAMRIKRNPALLLRGSAPPAPGPGETP